MSHAFKHRRQALQQSRSTCGHSTQETNILSREKFAMTKSIASPHQTKMEQRLLLPREQTPHIRRILTCRVIKSCPMGMCSLRPLLYPQGGQKNQSAAQSFKKGGQTKGGQKYSCCHSKHIKIDIKRFQISC